MRITATWTLGENHYLRLWRPGVNPDAESATPDYGPGGNGRPSAYFQSRVFPDQEALGLVFTGTSRWLEVRSPEESNPGPRTRRPIPGEGSAKPGLTDPVSIPAGTWILRAYHRAGGSPQVCDPASQERPKQVEGHNYDLRIELPRVTYRPSVKIDRPANDSLHAERFVEVAGRAGYPPHTQRPPGVREETAPPLGNVGYSWEGITNWEVPGSSRGATGGEPTIPRITLYMHGQSDAHPTPETGCVGQGEQDVVLCNGPFPPALGVPGRLTATINVPTFTANQRVARRPGLRRQPDGHEHLLRLRSRVRTRGHDGPVRLARPDARHARDRRGQRQPAAAAGNARQRSGHRSAANPPQSHPYPQNRPLSPALRVAWDPAERASRYEVYRSTIRRSRTVARVSTPVRARPARRLRRRRRTSLPATIARGSATRTPASRSS